MTKKERKELSDRIKAEWEKGNVVVMTVEGLEIAPVEDLVKQTTSMLLYDLNRDEATSYTLLEKNTSSLPFIRLVNDLAAAHVIEYLLEQKKRNTPA